ncbi:MAG: hypothetical protein AAFP83_19135, partial [Bacteroidota bacterium]
PYVAVPDYHRKAAWYLTGGIQGNSQTLGIPVGLDYIPKKGRWKYGVKYDLLRREIIFHPILPPSPLGDVVQAYRHSQRLGVSLYSSREIPYSLSLVVGHSHIRQRPCLEDHL